MLLFSRLFVFRKIDKIKKNVPKHTIIFRRILKSLISSFGLMSKSRSLKRNCSRTKDWRKVRDKNRERKKLRKKEKTLQCSKRNYRIYIK